MQPRILLIEDDAGRIEVFERWISGTEFILVAARSGGQAMGMLRHGGRAVAGLLLDHDLSDSPLTATDTTLSTSHLLPSIQQNIPRHVPVLIHSHNLSKPITMQRTLEAAGFSVTRTRFVLLHREPARFFTWLEAVRENWDPEGD